MPSRNLRLYHGTSSESAEKIMSEGLKRPGGVGPRWWMLTSSQGQAERYGRGAVVEFDVPGESVYQEGRTEGRNVLLPQEHNVYGFEATAYGLFDDQLPREWGRAIHRESNPDLLSKKEFGPR